MSELPPWLAQVHDALMEQRDQQRLPHALVLDACHGWGVDELAKALVNSLLGVDGDAAELVHPNLRWVAPNRGVIPVDAVRTTVDFLQQTSLAGDVKLAVIQSAHLMNKHSANALLKILEEPPAGRHLLLPTVAAGTLLPTILSRCQRVHIRQADVQTVVEWLEEHSCSGDIVQELLLEYGNAPYEVLRAFETKSRSLRSMLIDVTRSAAAVSQTAQALAELDVTDVVSRWQRITLRLAQRSRRTRAVPEFYTGLCDLRRQCDETSTLNLAMQYERLLFDWRALTSRNP